MVRIASKRDGFRRLGIAHPAAPTEYPDDRFSLAELALLKAEPMLVVTLVEEPKKPAPDKGDGKDKKKDK